MKKCCRTCEHVNVTDEANNEGYCDHPKLEKCMMWDSPRFPKVDIEITYCKEHLLKYKVDNSSAGEKGQKDG